MTQQPNQSCAFFSVNLPPAESSGDDDEDNQRRDETEELIANITDDPSLWWLGDIHQTDEPPVLLAPAPEPQRRTAPIDNANAAGEGSGVAWLGTHETDIIDASSLSACLREMAAFAERIVSIWNRNRFAGHERAGLGGSTPVHIACTQRTATSNSPLPLSPMVAQTRKRKVGRPKGAPKVHVPLKKLTVEIATSLTVLELRVYTKEICGRSPAQKNDAMKIVIDYIGDVAGNKKQRRR